MERPCKTDYYYLRSGDWEVFPVGMFHNDEEGMLEAIEVANDHAEKVGETALLYVHAAGLIDLIDDLQRAFNETHKDFIDDDE
jgi:hypothetical protein